MLPCARAWATPLFWVANTHLSFFGLVIPYSADGLSMMRSKEFRSAYGVRKILKTYGFQDLLLSISIDRWRSIDMLSFLCATASCVSVVNFIARRYDAT
jgi:hypothetical protein